MHYLFILWRLDDNNLSIHFAKQVYSLVINFYVLVVYNSVIIYDKVEGS